MTRVDAPACGAKVASCLLIDMLCLQVPNTVSEVHLIRCPDNTVSPPRRPLRCPLATMHHGFVFT
jgi:hypothetical protein